jgi:hypothetical protein
MVQPTQLLEHFGVVGIALEHSAVGTLSRFKLLLLLVDVTNLEPDVLFCQRARWIGDDVFEALLYC